MRRVAAVLLLVLVAGCSGGSPAPAPSPAAPTGWPVELEAEALGMAATDQGLIVVTSGTSRHPPQVHRFTADGKQAARQAAVGNPNGLAVDPSGAAWVPAVRHPDMVSGTGVPVLDPVSLQPRREINSGGEPLSVAFVGDEAWIGMRGRIAGVDRRTGRALRTIPIQGTAYELVAAGSAVAVLGDRSLLSLDARTGRRLAFRDLDDAGSLGGVLAGGALWVSYLDDGQAKLRRFDPRTLAPLGDGPVFGNRDVALSGGDVLWVADHEKGTLTCLDPATGRVRATVRAANSSALATDGTWAYLADGGRVNRVAARC
jgi:sugar lactone lactonase YvrE